MEPDIETYANDLSTQPVGADLTTLLNNIFSNIAGSLITISNAQLGSPGATGFINAWMAQYAPQYYCDAVALTVINQQFDHYQQLQFLAMGLLVEYYHWPQPGDPGSDPPTPPSPPQYYLANGVVSENAGASVAGYYDNIQAQASLLPFPSSGIGYTNEALNGMCDQIVYDTQNDIAWGYQNWAKASGNLTNIPALIGQLANCEGFVRVPTSEELSGMGSLGVAPAWDGPAYKYVSSVLGNQKVAPELFTLPNGATTLPQTPTWADMMSSLGFDTNILYSPAGNDPSVHVYMPFAALEILNLDLNNGSPWQRMMNGNGPSDQYQEGWECQLYSAATNNATQVSDRVEQRGGLRSQSIWKFGTGSAICRWGRGGKRHHLVAVLERGYVLVLGAQQRGVYRRAAHLSTSGDRPAPRRTLSDCRQSNSDNAPRWNPGSAVQRRGNVHVFEPGENA